MARGQLGWTRKEVILAMDLYVGVRAFEGGSIPGKDRPESAGHRFDTRGGPVEDHGSSMQTVSRATLSGTLSRVTEHNLPDPAFRALSDFVRRALSLTVHVVEVSCPRGHLFALLGDRRPETLRRVGRDSKGRLTLGAALVGSPNEGVILRCDGCTWQSRRVSARGMARRYRETGDPLG
jgi:hypothetical protein